MSQAKPPAGKPGPSASPGRGARATKPSPYTDQESARIALEVARSKQSLAKDRFERLPPDWADCALLAEENGEPGVEAWLKILAARSPERAEAARLVLDEAKAEPQVIPFPVRPEMAEPGPINLTDTGNATRFVRKFGDRLRYVPQWGKYLYWSDAEGRWKEDNTGQAFRYARKTVQAIGAEAASIDDDAERKATLKWAFESENRRRLDAMVYLARTYEGIAIEPHELNADRWLLNVLNGTIDLRTGLLRGHRREDLITRLAPVRFDDSAVCPRWERFEVEIMGGAVGDPEPGDPEANARAEEFATKARAMVAYLRRIAGYGLTAITREHQLYFLYGGGRNGKSLWLKIIQQMLGDYSITVNADLLTVKRHGEHSTGLTDMDGRRFVATIEVEDGKQLAEALVKSLTGGDMIRARRMRCDNYEFEPTHKIFLAANHKPEVRGTDEGIWSRIKLLPFPVTFVDDPADVAPPLTLLKNKDLEADLKAEWPGILAALVRSCVEWQRDGLKEPSEVADATAEYRAEMDVMANFLAERCSVPEQPRLRPSFRWETNSLYHAYSKWCHDAGVEALTSRKFGAELDKRKFPLRKSNGKSFREGLRLVEEATAAPDRY